MGIMTGWKSRWYASKQEFSQLLVEDQKIRNFVKTRKDKFGKPMYPAIAKIEIERTRDEVKVILFSARPGVLIGRKGERVEELQGRVAEPHRAADQYQDRGDQPARNRGANSWPRTSPSSWPSGRVSAAR